MTTQSVTQQLLGLVPVAAGALIALAGGGVKYWIDQNDKRKSRRRERLERLLHLAYDLKAWSSSLDGRYAFGTDESELPSPVEEMQVIGAIYFQDLSDEIKQVAIAAMRYRSTVHTLAAERLRSGGEPSADAGQRVEEAYTPLSEAIHTLAKRATNVAKNLS